MLVDKALRYLVNKDIAYPTNPIKKVVNTSLLSSPPIFAVFIKLTLCRRFTNQRFQGKAGAPASLLSLFLLTIIEHSAEECGLEVIVVAFAEVQAGEGGIVFDDIMLAHKDQIKGSVFAKKRAKRSFLNLRQSDVSAIARTVCVSDERSSLDMDYEDLWQDLTSRTKKMIPPTIFKLS
ncbi:hypothetical protein KCU92_g230, partial [Aureobasidium melanogenum]